MNLGVHVMLAAAATVGATLAPPARRLDESADAGTEFWNADLRRHVFHAAPAPATEDTEDVERMRARLSYLLESREELDDEWREELDEE